MMKKILIVDDEREFLELLQYRLHGERYAVSCAGSGTEALQEARTSVPDLILMDLLLPDLDGLSVVEILRRQPATRSVPVIMISAVTSDPTRSAAKLNGASAYLGKPLNFPALKRLIEALLALPPETVPVTAWEQEAEVCDPCARDNSLRRQNH